MTEENFADLLKRLRYERKLTQAKMAEMAGLELRAYQAYEYGERVDPGLRIIKNIINGLHLEPGEILGLPRKRELPKSNGALIAVISELQREIEDLKAKKLIPESWITRLASNDPRDLGAIAARAFLSNDLREIKELEVLAQIKNFGDTVLNKAKNE